jgi:hypothetical protein
MTRTIELLLGIAPMNQLNASAIPMDIFQETPDLTPYKAVLPRIATDNLLTSKPKNQAGAEWMKKSNRQNFAHADMADSEVLNAVIWFACTGNGSAFRDRRNCRPTKRCASESPTWITRNALPRKTMIDEAEFDDAL